jgi:hypothetical protein
LTTTAVSLTEEQPLCFTARVPRHSIEGSGWFARHAVYHIEIIFGYGRSGHPTSFELKKRYSDFHNLFAKLSAVETLAKNRNLAPSRFPKKIYFFNLRKANLDRRQDMFHSLLLSWCSDEDIRQSPIFRAFLGLEKLPLSVPPGIKRHIPVQSRVPGHSDADDSEATDASVAHASEISSSDRCGPHGADDF